MDGFNTKVCWQSPVFEAIFYMLLRAGKSRQRSMYDDRCGGCRSRRGRTGRQRSPPMPSRRSFPGTHNQSRNKINADLFLASCLFLEILLEKRRPSSDCIQSFSSNLYVLYDVPCSYFIRVFVAISDLKTNS
jgi:hypothetical protein